MRRLPRKRSEKQNRIIRATEEWFGKAMNPAEVKSSVKVALWLMGRRKRIELTQEEEEIAWMVGQNLKTEVGFENAL